jgi:vancomycin permeability regulator SanA
MHRKVAILGGLLGCLFLIPFVVIDLSQLGSIHQSSSDLTKADVALVLGAKVTGSGRLSPMLADRLNGAVQLYEKGIVTKLLLSGDRSEDYDEVSALRREALKLGVPEEALLLDYEGFSTYESCERAGQVFGLSNVIIVTQAFHAARSTYTCKSLGVEAETFAQPSFRKYPITTTQLEVREYFARWKALIQLADS